ncbi:hypothetical protein HW450_00420 [Corynebacterium hindlerae]|uniref:Uncharacterized protein n=1 Tax=Corynebacterium hindlerae TaxID=699041 RepID=A0A7G5FF75_9CORY|nr:hypothetical protein [Corynebacterium hindlerae]QMV85266.1 hypothetical protein HW450_00420 [Corynebacterium hindlerae]QTH58851.1 hypothetical protein J5O04_08380 [Corynebacterium hindlerae]
MPTEKLIPWLWFRLVALLAFFIFVMTQQMPLVAGITLILFVLTAFQLRTAYKNK